MKLSLLLLILFFASFSFKAHSLALDYSVIKTINKYKNYQSQISVKDLSLKDFFSYRIFKGPCVQLQEYIKSGRSDESILKSINEKCLKGVDGLKKLYLSQANS